jgi:hypothetical protein
VVLKAEVLSPNSLNEFYGDVTSPPCLRRYESSHRLQATHVEIHARGGHESFAYD